MKKKRIFIFPLIILTSIIAFISILYFFRSDDYPFYPRWTLNELESNFIGTLPSSASNIEYETAPAYALLRFDATPLDSIEFVNRFCNGFGYTGYDPFNAVDSEEQINSSKLIQSDHNRFYYSYSEDTPDSIWGNRCPQTENSGLVQIRVDRTETELHNIWIEIGGGCHSDISPTPCSGNRIEYQMNEDLMIDEEQQIEPRYQYGEMWNIEVESGIQYTLAIDSDEPINDYSGVSIRILPILEDNTQETYCASCWVDVRGVKIENNYQVSFLGSPTSVS